MLLAKGLLALWTSSCDLTLGLVDQRRHALDAVARHGPLDAQAHDAVHERGHEQTGGGRGRAAPPLVQAHVQRGLSRLKLEISRYVGGWGPDASHGFRFRIYADRSPTGTAKLVRKHRYL